jgi:hypothetical protein
MTAEIFGAIAQGIARNTSPEREAERATARRIKAEQEAKLQRIKATSTPEMVQLEADATKQELLALREKNNQLVRGFVKQRMFDSLDRYSSDNDPKHLTNMLREFKSQGLPTGPLGDIVRFDSLAEIDRTMLEQTGYDADAVLNSPEAKETLMRATFADGTTKLWSADGLKAATGYADYADNRELDRQLKRAKIVKLLQKGRAGGNTKDEREAARRVAERFPELEEGSAEYESAYNREFDNIIARNRQTSASKQEDEVDVIVANIDRIASERYGADFFELDMSKPQNRRVFEREIERMERMGELELSESEKKKISSIKQLLAVGGTASEEISNEETGIIDRFSRKIKKFVSNEVSGIEAESAYAAYRNVLRNALYGSVLTEGEMTAFREQFGDLGQQTGPVLAQFKVALQQLQGELEALANTNNSYVMHFRLGRDAEDLQGMIDGIEERLEFLDEFEKDKNVIKAPAKQIDTGLSDEDRAALDAIAAE